MDSSLLPLSVAADLQASSRREIWPRLLGWLAHHGLTRQGAIARAARSRRLDLDRPRLFLAWLVCAGAAAALTVVDVWQVQRQAAQDTAQYTLNGVTERLNTVMAEMAILASPAGSAHCGEAEVLALVRASLNSRFARYFEKHEQNADHVCSPEGPMPSVPWRTAHAPATNLTVVGTAPDRMTASRTFGADPGMVWLVRATLDHRSFEGTAGSRPPGAAPRTVQLLSTEGRPVATLATTGAAADSADPFLVHASTAKSAIRVEAHSGRHGMKVAVSISRDDLLSLYLQQGFLAVLLVTVLTGGLVAAVWNSAVKRARLVNRIAIALRRRQFEPHVQPIIELDTGRCVGGEVLMRWHHPQRGVLAPFEFIAEAERTGLIVGMSDLVMVRAAQRLSHLARLQPDLYFSFNITPQQLREPGFARRLDEIFNSETLPREQVLLELTEREFLDQGTCRSLNALRRAGWRIAIDDFGTGQSSLASLEQLQIDRIKIDRAFVRTIDEHTVKRPVLDAIISLARQLGVQLIAEGVESPSQQQYLRERGVHFAQGYLFSKPLAIDAFARWLWQKSSPAAADSPGSPATVTAASAAPPLLDSQMLQLWMRMRTPGGLDVRARMHGLRSYAHCFVGREAVDWLVRHQRVDRQHAVQMGQRLMALGLIRHVLDEHDFKDAELFYGIVDDKGSLSPETGADGLAEGLRGPDGPRWRNRSRGPLRHGACATGREIVAWIVARHGVSRDTARQWANQLMGQGQLRHVFDDQPVRDDNNLYRLA